MASRSHTSNTGFWWSFSVFYLWSRTVGDRTTHDHAALGLTAGILHRPVLWQQPFVFSFFSILRNLDQAGFNTGETQVMTVTGFKILNCWSSVWHGVRRRNHWFLGICKHSQGIERSWVENLRRTNFVCIIHFTSVTPLFCELWNFRNADLTGKNM